MVVFGQRKHQYLLEAWRSVHEALVENCASQMHSLCRDEVAYNSYSWVFLLNLDEI